MKIAFDPRYNVAYLRFPEKPEEVETIRLSDEILIDLAGLFSSAHVSRYERA